jgi:hypothetical protein
MCVALSSPSLDHHLHLRLDCQTIHETQDLKGKIIGEDLDAFEVARAIRITMNIRHDFVDTW